jgi:hypothetical protein
VIALLALLLASPSLPPSVQPWPIGNGPGFRLEAGSPPEPLRCTAGRRYGVHLELFVRRQVVIVPAGIGVPRPRSASFGRIRPGRCTHALRTLDPTGVIEVGRRATLGEFFTVWRQPLGPRRIAGFRSRTPLLAFVDGRRWRGDPRRIPLSRHVNIVLELGGYVPPHPRYLFPPGL